MTDKNAHAPSEEGARPEPFVEPFVETETEETQLHYGLGTFAWPLRIIWFGFACLAVYYVAVFYVPSLRAWMSWSPPSH